MNNKCASKWDTSSMAREISITYAWYGQQASTN